MRIIKLFEESPRLSKITPAELWLSTSNARLVSAQGEGGRESERERERETKSEREREKEREKERERAREREKERESDSDAVVAEAVFEPVGDATKYCWEQDCAYPFDDAGLSARYLDQG